MMPLTFMHSLRCPLFAGCYPVRHAVMVMEPSLVIALIAAAVTALSFIAGRAIRLIAHPLPPSIAGPVVLTKPQCALWSTLPT